MSTVFPVGPGGWVPGRGDYGAEYATDLIRIIEQRNCVKGCTHAGSPAEVAEFGPGGCCPILARTFTEDALPEIDPRPDGPHCDARHDPATTGTTPLIEETARA
jgi:hypothetical protein